MIQITCTSCRAKLAIDEAFAGGVCRCRHCGTIQTVPKPQSRRAATPHGMAAPRGSPQSASQGTAPAEGTGLEDLASVVASSGLSGTGLQSRRLQAPPPSSPPRHPIVWIIAGAGIALLGLLAGIWITSGSKENRSGTGGASPSGSPTLQAPAPEILGIPIAGPSVVLLLDRGQSMGEAFDPMKLAVLRSLRTLGPQRQFQIVFWETDSVLSIPSDGLKPAGEQSLEAASAALADVFHFGPSRIEPALAKAMAQKPAEMILITAKFGLDDEFVKRILDARGANPVKIHAISLGDAGSPMALRSIAQKTGGEFRSLDLASLRALAG